MTNMGKLNVGRNRCAHEALDAMVMREALEALEILDKWLSDRVTAIRCPVCKNAVVPWHVSVCSGARAAITKLEERLLNE
ncbi:hypothetical protein LCGC14_0989880 [marine sediment metagenome]|uniref:Uncharacterized protein n=1 Tax=marine sediment metagenome TaxID=412755 RepID=A0A0F9N603_9ZZZZ